MKDFKTADAASYDPLTGAFARFTAITTQPFARHMVEMAALRPSDHVLDVGTGSGIVAIEAAARLNGHGRVSAIDLSRPMLLEARARARQARGADRLSLAAADAEKLPFADHTFDCVVSLFAVVHFPDPSRAISEMVRVLKPGGRVVIGIGSRPPLNTWKGWSHYIGRLPDAINLSTGRLLMAPAFLDRIVEQGIPGDAALEETALARRRGMRGADTLRLMRRSGLTQVRADWYGQRTEFSDVDEFWELQRTFSSTARKRLGGASPAQIAETRRLFNDGCRRVLSRGGRLAYHSAVLLIAARRS
jgi:ubiquinone/menaquinone biosynthesis C-methylase UbiE